MKLTPTVLLATSLVLSSCSLTPEQKATLSANALKDANAALLGGLSTGTWAGAAAGATAQEIENLRARPLTAPKNPGTSVNPR